MTSLGAAAATAAASSPGPTSTTRRSGVGCSLAITPRTVPAPTGRADRHSAWCVNLMTSACPVAGTLSSTPRMTVTASSRTGRS